MSLNAWSAIRRATDGQRRLLTAVALAVAALAATASPSDAAGLPPASSGAGAQLIGVSPQQITRVLRVGESTTHTVTVTNFGDAAVRLVGAEVFGDNLGLDWQFAQGCFGNVLAPGATCSYTMTFAPAVAGRLNGAYCVTGVSETSTIADRECGGIHGVAL